MHHNRINENMKCDIQTVGYYIYIRRAFEISDNFYNSKAFRKIDLLHFNQQKFLRPKRTMSIPADLHTNSGMVLPQILNRTTNTNQGYTRDQRDKRCLFQCFLTNNCAVFNKVFQFLCIFHKSTIVSIENNKLCTFLRCTSK